MNGLAYVDTWMVGQICNFLHYAFFCVLILSSWLCPRTSFLCAYRRDESAYSHKTRGENRPPVCTDIDCILSTKTGGNASHGLNVFSECGINDVAYVIVSVVDPSRLRIHLCIDQNVVWWDKLFTYFVKNFLFLKISLRNSFYFFMDRWRTQRILPCTFRRKCNFCNWKRPKDLVSSAINHGTKSHQNLSCTVV
jgi:hypothetical protein